MVMKTVRMLIMSCIILGSLLMLPNAIYAAHKQEVIDEVDLFSDKEVKQLQNLAEKYGAKRDISYYIITIDDPGSGNVEDYTDAYYDDEIKTGDEEVDTIMLVIDMKNREVDIGGFGSMHQYLDDARVDMIHDEIGADLSDGNYFAAMKEFLKTSYDYSGYKIGANPQNPFYNIFVQLLVAIVIGAGIVWGMVHNAGGKVTTNRRTYEDSERSQLLQRHDRYIRTSVTKRRKPKPKSGGGGGSGGGGRGRMTSGGSMRSGGSRGF